VLTLQAPCPPRYQSLVAGSGSQPTDGGVFSTKISHGSSPVTVPFGGSTQHVTSTQFQTNQPRFSPAQQTTTSSLASQPSRPSPVVISVMPCAPATIPSDTPIFTPIDGGRRRLDLVLDLGRQYAAQDVVVKVDGRKMFVEATREEKEQGRVCKSTVQREFDLSEDIDPSTVQAMMKPDGQIAIMATTGFKQ